MRNRDGKRRWTGLGGAAALLAAWLLLGLAVPGTALAAPTRCPEQHPDGVAPDIVRPGLATDTTELCFEGYAVLYSGVSRTGLASAEHLTRERVEAARRVRRENAFHEEDRLPEGDRARLADYARSGFDRGHLAPSGDMPSPEAQEQSFSLANMVPQRPASNRCLWEGIESATRTLATREGDIWVLTGPIFEGKSLDRLNGRVLVPTALFKAVYLPGRREAAAFVAPNSGAFEWRVVSLAELRNLAGLDAFPSLPAAVQQHAAVLPQPTPHDPDCGRGAGRVDRRGDEAGGPQRAPPAAPPAAGWTGNRTLVLSAVFALVAIVLLWRALGRRS